MFIAYFGEYQLLYYIKVTQSSPMINQLLYCGMKVFLDEIDPAVACDSPTCTSSIMFILTGLSLSLAHGRLEDRVDLVSCGACPWAPRKSSRQEHMATHCGGLQVQTSFDSNLFFRIANYIIKKNRG